jgi:hypothetical protein
MPLMYFPPDWTLLTCLFVYINPPASGEGLAFHNLHMSYESYNSYLIVSHKL